MRIIDLSPTSTSLLEHVPEKLIDFSDWSMLQLIDSERFLFDRMIPPDREPL